MANQVVVGAGGDVIGPIKLQNQNSTIVAQLKLNGATGVSLTPQVRVSDAAAWTSVKATDPATKTDVSTLTGDGQIIWIENIGYSDFRLLQAVQAVGVANADVFVNIGPDED